MRKDFPVHRLDVKAFAQESGELSGEDRVGAHSRLVAETHGRATELPVAWEARGELRNSQHVHPQVWMHLRASTSLSLLCQRCLAPVTVGVSVDRSFRFVPDEQTAAAEDEQSEEDVLALTPSFDLMELIVDELLMELPVAPRHEVCPEPVPMSVADREALEEPAARENPFALLRGLKSGKA